VPGAEKLFRSIDFASGPACEYFSASRLPMLMSDGALASPEIPPLE
jgi:hypothetical protein